MDRIVVAPDKFKGSLTASEAAAAIVRGVRQALGKAVVSVLPMSDGGEGFTEALLASLGGQRRQVQVTGPVGEPVTALYGELADDRRVLETAGASGLQVMPEGHKDPLGATSFGTGQLLLAAAASPAKQILCGLGGSAYNDGGTGAARALGWRFLDATGSVLDPSVDALLHLAAIEAGPGVERIEGVHVTGAYDVDNPLVGPAGAAAVFGPQKGASPGQVEVIARAHQRLAERIEADLGLSVAELPASGASGGLGAGLIAFFGADLRPGFDLVAEAAGLNAEIERADLVITGEGSLDGSSKGGKTPAGVGRLASASGVRCIAVAGSVDLSQEDLEAMGVAEALSLVDSFGRERAMGDAAALLTQLVATTLA
jgi:glycerate kinase